MCANRLHPFAHSKRWVLRMKTRSLRSSTRSRQQLKSFAQNLLATSAPPLCCSVCHWRLLHTWDLRNRNLIVYTRFGGSGLLFLHQSCVFVLLNFSQIACAQFQSFSSNCMPFALSLHMWLWSMIQQTHISYHKNTDSLCENVHIPLSRGRMQHCTMRIRWCMHVWCILQKAVFAKEKIKSKNSHTPHKHTAAMWTTTATRRQNKNNGVFSTCATPLTREVYLIVYALSYMIRAYAYARLH